MYLSYSEIVFKTITNVNTTFNFLNNLFTKLFIEIVEYVEFDVK